MTPKAELITRAGAALIEVATNSERTMKERARILGWSERDLSRQLAELETAGAITRTKVANRTRYEIHFEAQVGSLLPHLTVGEFLEAMKP